MKSLAPILMIISSLSSAATLNYKSPSGYFDLTLKTSAKYGGAVYSLKVGNKEFLDHADNGRLLQSAASFDGLGECYNPTEGGSSPVSLVKKTSHLKSSFNDKNNIWSVAQMGFWLNPNENYPNGCGGNADIVTAQNKTLTSPYWLSKHINLNANVITVTTSFYVPQAHKTGTFEALTGYLPWNFYKSFYFDPATGMEYATGNSIGEQQYPVIHVDTFGSDAIGIFSPSLPQDWYGAKVGYGRFYFHWEGVNKFNCVFRENNIKANSHHEFTCIVVVGKKTQVKEIIANLYKQYQN